MWGNRTDGEPASGPVADAPDTPEDTGASSPDPALAASLAAAGPAAGSVAVGPTSYWDRYTFDVIGNRVGMAEHSPLDPTKATKLAYGYGTTVTGNGTSPTIGTQPHTPTDVTSTPAGRGARYTYDLAGNTKLRDLADVTQDLEWTPENRLEQITSDGVTTTYVYDADGNRILESTPSGSVLYLGETELRTAGGKITRAKGHGPDPSGSP